MSRVPALTTVAVLGSLVAGCFLPGASAQAAHRENVLRDFCAGPVKTSCVTVMDNDEGVLTVRDRRGHRHTFRSSAAALRYLRHHATPCREEDSPSCYWDAAVTGNGAGDSFIDVGGRALFYLGNLD